MSCAASRSRPASRAASSLTRRRRTRAFPVLRHESEHHMRGRPAPCWKTGLPQSPHRIFMRPFRVRVGLWDSYRAGSTDRRGPEPAPHGGRWMGVCRTAHTMQTLADSQSAADLKGPALPPLPPAHRYPGCFGSTFFGLARPPCAAVLRAWWYSHRDWSMCSRWSSGSPMWSTWLAGQSHRSPVSPRMAMHRCPSRSSTARRMDAQFGGSGEVRPLVALQGIPPPKLQPRRSAPS